MANWHDGVVRFLFLRGLSMGSKNGSLVRSRELVEVHFSILASLIPWTPLFIVAM